MQYELNKKENGVFEASVKIDHAEWEKYLDSAFEKNKGRFTVQGFRKGHAPRSVIEKQYGVGAFMNEALDEAYYKTYTQILKEHEEVKPIDQPKLDIKKFDDQGLEFVLTLTCVPEFKLANYKGLEFKRQAVSVEDKDVEEEIKHELLRASRLVETKQPVKLNDYVTLDFDGYVDGKRFDGGKAENYQLQIGSHSFIDNFEDQLVGLNIGDKKDVEVTFPTEYHEASLAGKPATFKCEIKNVRERITPELDDEFVSNSTEFENVEDYRKSIKDRLVKRAEEKADIELDNDILDKIIDDTDFTAPETLVDQEVQRQLNGMTAQMRYQGITLEDYVKYLGKTMDEFKEDLKKNSARNVKGRYVLEKLIRDENLDINEEDIDKKIEEMAKEAGKPVEEFKKQVNNDMVNRVANEILMKKLLDFLHANNTIN